MKNGIDRPRERDFFMSENEEKTKSAAESETTDKKASGGVIGKRWFQLSAVIVLVGAFVLFSRVWKPETNRESQNIVAEVAGHKITSYQFQVAINRRLLRIMNVEGRLSSSQKEGVMLSVFKQLMNDKILEITAEEAGVKVQDEDITAHRRVLIDRLTRQAEAEAKQSKRPDLMPSGEDLYNHLWSMLGFRHEMEFLEYLKYEIFEQKLAAHLFPAKSFTVTDGDIASYIPRVELRQIFFQALDPSRDTAADPRQDVGMASKEQYQAAMKVYEQLKNGADFAEMAKKHSQESYAASGGYIGWISEKAVVKEYWEVASRLEPGDITEPFFTPYGLHILKCLDRREPSDELFNRFKGVVKDSTLRRKQQSSFVQWFYKKFRELEESGQIKIYHPVLLANKLRNTGDFDGAVNAYMEAIKTDSEGAPYYHIDIAWILARQQKYAEALKELRIATEKAPTDPYLFLMLGEGFMEVGELEKALSEFQKASELSKLDYELHRKLMSIYSQLGLIKEAEREQQRMTHAIELLGGAQKGNMGPNSLFKEPKFKWPETPSVREDILPPEQVTP